MITFHGNYQGEIDIFPLRKFYRNRNRNILDMSTFFFGTYE